MMDLLPFIDPMLIMEGVVQANANYITRMTMREINTWHNVRGDGDPMDLLSADARGVLKNILSRKHYWYLDRLTNTI